MAIFQKITRSGKLYLPTRPNNAIKYKQKTEELPISALSNRVGEFIFVSGTDKEKKEFESAKKTFAGYYDFDSEMFDIDRGMEEDTEQPTEGAGVKDKDPHMFAIDPLSKGWYNVINIHTGEVMNEKKHRKEEAEKLAYNLNN